MALFKKRGKEKEKEEIPKFPELPRLPELPDFPKAKEIVNETRSEPVPQLPSFPSNSLGDKFSQNTIKEAVTGKKERMEEDDESPEQGYAMPRPLIQPVNQATKPRVVAEEAVRNEKPEEKAEPIFIRIDRFEEGSRIFEEVKKQIAEVEKMSAGVARIKEEEDKELAAWEAELKQIKEKIENIDRNIFSKHK